MNIRVLYNGDTYIEEIVQDVEWSGDVKQAYRTLNISLLNTLDGKTRVTNFEVGRELRFYSEGAEIFRGIIFRSDVDHSGNMRLTAYDESVYLTKNTDTRKFSNVTASQIVRQLCTEFGVAVGTIADTNYVIPKLILRDMTLWNMITTALTVTRKQTGRRYFVYASGGRLNLAERRDRKATYLLESTSNLQTASYSQSIEDLRNQVRVIGGKEEAPIIASASNSVSAARYGTMQHLERADSEAKTAEIRQLADQLLRDLNVIDDEASITALGYNDTYAGVSVYVYDAMTGITGNYYVSSDTHTYSNGMHTMSLTLSATDDLPTLEYVPPTEPEKKTKKVAEGDWKYWLNY
ncbi:XkdQ/YqbQ family protein [Paenibacillus sp. LPE1-1-1.1]|uniref:XkdQ/YqbQ family protein n=1 Tax=Paenibacillus sp. LPE1-1-1.1 TaxID=3135230 RepID=UPI003443D717